MEQTLMVAPLMSPPYPITTTRIQEIPTTPLASHPYLLRNLEGPGHPRLDPAAK